MKNLKSIELYNHNQIQVFQLTGTHIYNHANTPLTHILTPQLEFTDGLEWQDNKQNFANFEIHYKTEKHHLLVRLEPSFIAALFNDKGDEILISQSSTKLDIEDLEFWAVVEALIVWSSYLAGIKLRHVPLDKQVVWELVEDEDEMVDLSLASERIQVEGLTGRFYDAETFYCGNSGYQPLITIEQLRERLSPQVDKIAIIPRKLTPPPIREYYELIESNSLLKRYFYPYSSAFDPNTLPSVIEPEQVINTLTVC